MLQKLSYYFAKNLESSQKKCYTFRLSLKLRSQANYIQLLEGEKFAETIWLKSGFCKFVLYGARGIGICSTESVCLALLLFQPLTIGVKLGKVGIRSMMQLKRDTIYYYAVLELIRNGSKSEYSNRITYVSMEDCHIDTIPIFERKEMKGGGEKIAGIY